MDWKNQLTKTPYLVLFIVLITIGVGTASALITITLAGHVHITGDTDIDGNLNVDGDLYVGTTTTNDWDSIFMDDGTESFRWIDGTDWFEVSNDLNVDGVIDAGSGSVPVPYNRFGFHQTDHGLSGENDLFVHEDLEVNGDVYADGDIECTDCIDSLDITNGTIQAEDIANGAAIKSISVGGEWFVGCDECEQGATVNMISTSNSMCFLVDIHYKDQGIGEHVTDSRCTISDVGGTWVMEAWGGGFGDDEVFCQARCLTWD